MKKELMVSWTASILVVGILFGHLYNAHEFRKETEQKIEMLSQSASSTEKWIKDQPIVVDVPEPEGPDKDWDPAIIRIPVKDITLKTSQCFLGCMASYQDPQYMNKDYCAEDCKNSHELYEEFSQGKAVQLIVDSLGLKYSEGTERTITTPEKLVR